MVPLDKFVSGTAAWSTLTDYDVYMEQQRWFRARFAEPPLVVEFRLWLDYISLATAAAR